MMRFVTICALLLLLNIPAHAGSPAAIPPDSARGRATMSFESFASEWMAKVRTLEEKHRSNPDVKLGATEPVVTYRGYGEDYDVELRPTGNARSPYVGLLRYTERVYSCKDLETGSCTVASSVPVTEIFRFQNGRWTY